MAVKDGKLLGGPPGRGSFAGYRTRFSQKAQTRFCHRIGRALPGRSRLRKSTLCHALTLQWRTEGWRRNLPRTAPQCPAVSAEPFGWPLLFRRRDLPRSALALPFRRGKTDVFEPCGWPLNLALSKAANGPPGGPSSCHAVKAWRKVLFQRRDLCRLALWLAFEPCSICHRRQRPPSEKAPFATP